jgi:predicted Zn-dependent protease
MCLFCPAPSVAPSSPWSARRAFLLAAGAGAAAPVLAQVDVGTASSLRKLVPAETLEKSAAQQYQQMLQQAKAKRALAPDNHPQLQRLHAIAKRLIPHATPWNERARQWRWEVNLIGSKQLNAFCMPGGKIMFYSGLIEQLDLSDDEIAIVMGHEVAHALREHSREQVSQAMAAQTAIGVGAAVLGVGQAGADVAGAGYQALIASKFSRTDESEADRIGLELTARAGYDPRAGVTLWQKMINANQGGRPPELLSSHPAEANRVREIEALLPTVMPLYTAARR